ncbi:tetratricopeptide repeat protein [Bacteroidota bacterium]
MRRVFFVIVLSSQLFFIIFSTSTAQESTLPENVKKLMLNGNYKQAIDTMSDLLKSDSTNFELLYNLGLAHQRLFQYSKARDALYKAYEYEKFDIPLLMALGRNYKYMGASNYAVMFFEQAYVIDSTDTNIKLDLANSYLESFEVVKAEKFFRRLFESDSTNGYICKQMAYCNFKLGNNDEAIRLYTIAKKLNEYDATIAIQLGNLLVRKEEYEKAYYVVRKGLETNGINQHLHRLAAEILFKLKRYHSAGLQYENLIQNGDRSAVHFQRLGFCYYITATDTTLSNDSTRVVRFNNAIDSFSKAVELDDNDALAYMYMGLSYKELDSLEISTDIISTSIDRMIPDYIADAYSHIGNNFELTGNYESAIKAYRKASEYNPDNANIIFQLATLYDKYYEDKNVPMMYYKKFLKESDKKDEVIIEYVEERMQAIREYLHFRM